MENFKGPYSREIGAKKWVELLRELIKKNIV